MRFESYEWIYKTVLLKNEISGKKNSSKDFRYGHSIQVNFAKKIFQKEVTEGTNWKLEIKACLVPFQLVASNLSVFITSVLSPEQINVYNLLGWVCFVN